MKKTESNNKYSKIFSHYSEFLIFSNKQEKRKIQPKDATWRASIERICVTVNFLSVQTMGNSARGCHMMKPQFTFLPYHQTGQNIKKTQVMPWLILIIKSNLHILFKNIKNKVQQKILMQKHVYHELKNLNLLRYHLKQENI